MPQLVQWRPVPAPNIVAFRLLYSDTGADGAFEERATVLNVQSGPNWNPTTSTFMFTDDEVPYRLYRLWTVDAYGNVFQDTAAAPFPPNNDPVDAPVSTVFPLNENTQGANQFQYVTPGGSPISDATIRVYRKISWDTRQYSQVVGMTTTLPTGGWKLPIFVTPGETYVVHFHKPNEWGPDTVEVTI